MLAAAAADKESKDALIADSPRFLHAACSGDQVRAGGVCVRLRQRLCACAALQADVLSALLSAGLPHLAADTDGFNALHECAMSDAGHCLAALTRKAAPGAALEAVDGSGATPLLHAAQRGSASVVLALLKLSASVTAQDSRGRTALHLAACGPKDAALAVTAALLARGARPSQPDLLGRSAVHNAAAAGNTDALSSLLAHDKALDINARDGQGRTALHHGWRAPRRLCRLRRSLHVAGLRAAAAGGHTDAVRTLLSAGADALVLDSHGLSARSCAAFSGTRRTPRPCAYRADRLDLTQASRTSWRCCRRSRSRSTSSAFPSWSSRRRPRQSAQRRPRQWLRQSCLRRAPRSAGPRSTAPAPSGPALAPRTTPRRATRWTCPSL